MISWHDSQWRSLLGNGLDRLGHANLLIGHPGLGQREFADALAALLLCHAPITGKASGENIPHACGTCNSCRWLKSDSHPDFRCLQPDDADEASADAEASSAGEGKTSAGKKASSTIKIAAVRELEDFVFVGSHCQGRRVILIDPADAMNVHAANALLKILEEPPSSVYFILVSAKHKNLLPTLRSRCRSLVFERPARAEAEAWLRSAGADTRAAQFLGVANGAPAMVLTWQNAGVLPAMATLIDSLFALARTRSPDPLALAGQWDALLKKESALTLELLVDTVQRWLFDLSTQQGTGALHYHADWPRAAAAPPESAVSMVQLVRGWRELLRFRRSARHPLNQLLFLEDFATHLLRAISPPTRTSP